MLPDRCIFCLRHTTPRFACINDHGHDYTDDQAWLAQVEVMLNV